MPETGTHDTFLVMKHLNTARTQEPPPDPQGETATRFLSAHNASLTWSTLSNWTPNSPPNPQMQSTCKQHLESLD